MGSRRAKHVKRPIKGNHARRAILTAGEALSTTHEAYGGRSVEVKRETRQLRKLRKEAVVFE